MMDAHFKNVEKSSQAGKFDPFAGLATSGIAGTGPDKDKEEEESKPVSSIGETPPKETGKLALIISIFEKPYSINLLSISFFLRTEFGLL